MIFPRCLIVSLTFLGVLETTAASRWVKLAPLPEPRQEHSSVTINKTTIAVVGGVKPIGDPSNPMGMATTDSVQLYDIPSDTWRTVSPIPFKVNHPNVAALKGKIYVLGGLVDSEDNSAFVPDWIASGESHVYNSTTDSWTKLQSMPPGSERGSAVIGVQGEIIYVAGGMTYLKPGQQDAMTTVTAFNTTSGKWLRLPSAATNISEGRQHGVGAIVGGIFYVIGGRWFEKTNVRGTVFKLDLNNQAAGWKTSRGRMPVPRGGISGAVVDDRFFTFGGEANPNSVNGLFNETEAFNMRSERWSKLSPMAVPVHGTSAVAVGNRIYIAGGGLQEDGIPVIRGGVERFFETTDHFSAFSV